MGMGDGQAQGVGGIGAPVHRPADGEQIGQMRLVDRTTLAAVVEEFLAELEEIGLAYEPHMIDIGKNETWIPEYLALNPNGVVPTLTDGDTVTGEVSLLDTDGAFVAIGHAPATELFKGKLEMDASGYLLVEPGTPKTGIPGVFACGDVMDHTYRQAVTAAGMGCMAV